MKKTILFLLSFSIVSTSFAEHVVLNYVTLNTHSRQKIKVGIQWAATAKEIDENDNIIRQGLELNLKNLKILTKLGKINLDIPEKAQYFRVLVWSNKTSSPDLLTNWVELIPNKTYTLDDDHLVPAVLLSGAGC